MLGKLAQLAKRVILATDMLWESYSKCYSKHIWIKIFYKNIVSLKVIITIKFYIDLYEKSALEHIYRIFLLIDHFLLSIVQGTAVWLNHQVKNQSSMGFLLVLSRTWHCKTGTSHYKIFLEAIFDKNRYSYKFDIY